MALNKLSEGSVVAGRYRVVRPLSAGAMGEVYVVEHLTTKKLRALKLMQRELVGDETLRARFVQEAQIGSRIESEHVVEVIDAGVDDAIGSPFIAMELLRGETLGALAQRAAPLAPGLVRDVFEQLCHALAAAHDRGVVHRDLKPDNVFLARAQRVGQASFTVKILDFGIAKLVTEARTRATAPIGTPLFMAPEQMVPGGAIGAQSDVWALGLMAFQLLAGKPYWLSASDRGSSAAMLINEVQNLPFDLASERLARLRSSSPGPGGVGVTDVTLPDGFDAWFARAVDREIMGRFASAREAWTALEEVLRDAPDAAYPATSPERGAEPDAKQRASVPPPANEDRESTADESTDAFLARKSAERSAPRAPVATGVESRTSISASAPTELARTPVAETRPPRRRPGAAAPLAIVGVAGAAAIALYFGLRAPSTPAPSGSSSSAPRAPAVVTAFACAPAKLDGADVTPELAAAVGVGACARAAIALDVDWSSPAGTPLEVVGTLGPSGAAIELRAAGVTSRAEAKTPLEAIVAAVPALVGALSSPPLPESEIRAWGASDEASAHRLRRAWNIFVLRLTPDHEKFGRDLVASDPDSAWSWLLKSSAHVRGTPQGKEAEAKALSLADKLPKNRALAVRGALAYRGSGSGSDRRNSLSQLRQAYQDDAEDDVVATIAGTVALAEGAYDEGRAIGERLYARAPTKSINVLVWSINTEEEHDLARDRRYLEKLWATLPESLGWPNTIAHHVLQGRLDDARASIAFAERFGHVSSAADAAGIGWIRAWIQLVERDPAKAREIAAVQLGDPRGGVSTDAHGFIISSLLLEGRVVDGESALFKEIERQRATVSPFQGTFAVLDLLRVRRWLGRPPPDARLLDWLDEALVKYPDYTAQAESLVRTELALARAASAGAAGKANAAKALDAIEAMAEARSAGDRGEKEAILVATIPLVRLVRGEAEAAKRWTETARAPFRRRRLAALDAGLALEAIGDEDSALAAYALSQDPILIDQEGFATLAAMIREAHMEASRESPRYPALDATLTRLMKGADPGIRDAIEKL